MHQMLSMRAHWRSLWMKGFHGKEGHHDGCRIDQCHAVWGNLARWFSWSVSHGNGDACREVIPEEGPLIHRCDRFRWKSVEAQQ